MDGSPSNPETLHRIQEIQRWRIEGLPLSTIRLRICDQWQVGERQARKLIHEAQEELKRDWVTVERPTLVAEQINRLEQIAMKAEEAGQYAAAVGALKAIARITQIINN